MKILFVCHRLPYPPNRGGKIRPFNMIQHLSRKHEVVVASLAETKQELREGAELEKHCAEFIIEVLPRFVRWSQAFAALLTKTPSSVAYFRSVELYRRVRRKLQEEKFDLVMVHCAFVAQYVTDCQGGVRILDYGDLDSGKWKEYAQHKGFPLSLAYELEAKKLLRYETMLAALFHHCTVTTKGEMDSYASMNVSTPCHVIPNGVDGRYFTQHEKGPQDSQVIVFLGRMDYYPNIDGISHFVENVFPIIRRTLPQVQLRIIGSNPTRAVCALSQIPGITVTGHVPDVRPYLSDAMVAVAPLRIARGTQNKILESMAMGIPVVATPQAAKGIQSLPGKHLLVAENHGAFAARVIELILNPDLRQYISLSGRRQVESAHQWESSMAILDRVLEQSRIQVRILESK